MEREQFNALNVQAPLPGKAAVEYDAGPEVQPEVPAQPPAPEPESEVSDPRQLIDEAMSGQPPVRKPQSFAEKKRMAEIEEEQRRQAALTEIERMEGLAQLGQTLQQYPELTERVVAAYQEIVEGQPSAPAPYSPSRPQPPGDPKSREEIARLSQQVAEMQRVMGLTSVHTANQIVQGRHHLKQEDMSRIVKTAVERGWLYPGINPVAAEQALEDARRIALFDRAKTDGKRDFVDQLDQKARAATSNGAASGSARQSYDTKGKSFADIRRDAKAAGTRGL